MQIKELHPDIERYLLHDCYCPHQVYSSDGFFYQLFYEDQECEKIGEVHIKGVRDVVACVAHPDNKDDDPAQIVVFFLDGDKCYDSCRYDATENNIDIIKIYLEKGFDELKKTGRKFDEYEEGATAKSLKEILSRADAVIVD